MTANGTATATSDYTAIALTTLTFVDGQASQSFTIPILDDTIAENGSWAPVVSGSVFTQRQVLEVMMLPSANNYSKTLAIWAFGRKTPSRCWSVFRAT